MKIAATNHSVNTLSAGFLIRQSFLPRLSSFLWCGVVAMEVNIHTFYFLALDAGNWSASQSAPLYLRGKRLRNPLRMRFRGPQSWSGHTVNESFQSVPGIEPLSFSSAADGGAYYSFIKKYKITNKVWTLCPSAYQRWQWDYNLTYKEMNFKARNSRVF
jgi:hypothetical protein